MKNKPISGSRLDQALEETNNLTKLLYNIPLYKFKEVLLGLETGEIYKL